MLASGDRLAIITFMSLDDRMTKLRFRELTTLEGDRHDIFLRPEDIATPKFHLATRKPILPSEEELAANPRAASAKLRVLVKD